MRHKSRLRLLVIVFSFIALLVGAFALAHVVSTNLAAQAVIAEFGYIGVLFLAIIAGLNAIVPVPAAVFTPIFTAAGLALPLIVITLVVGTLIADAIGYFFGRWSADTIAARYPKTHTFFVAQSQKRYVFIFAGVIVYAAIIPLPNELIVIPLAITGIPFIRLLPPLLIGNIIHQSSLAYGFESLFLWLS